MGGTVAGNHTHGNQIGIGYKFGNLLFLTMNVSVTAKDPAATGMIRVAGLPDYGYTTPRSGLSIGSLININPTGFPLGNFIVELGGIQLNQDTATMQNGFVLQASIVLLVG